MHVVFFWYSYQKTNACRAPRARVHPCTHACPSPCPCSYMRLRAREILALCPPQSSKNTYLQRTLNSLPLQSSKIHIFQQNLNILPLQNSKICMLPMKSQHSALPKLQNTYISIETSKSCPPKASKWTHFQRNLSILPFQSWNISLTTSQQSARPELQNA